MQGKDFFKKISDFTNKNIKIIAGSLMIIGLFLQLSIFALGIKNIFENFNYTEVTASVIGYSPLENGTFEEVVEYEVDSQRFKQVLINESDEPNGLGATVMIKYQNENPEKIIWMDTTNRILPTIFGAVFFFLGLYLFIKNNRKAKV